MYRIEIQFTTGWQFVEQVSFEGCSLQRYRDENSVRIRDKLDGSITFYGDTYKNLLVEKNNNVIQLNCKIYLNSDEIYSGKLQLRGEWAERSNKCLLIVEIQDEYTTILRNIDIEHDYIRPKYNVQLKTNVQIEVRKAFQMRAIHASGGEDSPHITFLWHFCDGASVDVIEKFDYYKYYTKTDYVLDATNEGYMSKPENVKEQFCWILSALGEKRFFACTEDSLGNYPPGDLGFSNEHWRLVGSGLTKPPQAYWMGQRYAAFKFEDAEFSDDDKEWQRGGCDEGQTIENLTAPTLYYYLSDMIGRADPAIQIDFSTFFPYLDATSPTYKNLAVYTNQWKDEKGLTQYADAKYKLSDLIAIYMSVFDCDWRLEGGVFVFRHKSEHPQIPDASKPYQFVDSIFSKDWSFEGFNSDLKFNVYRESFTIGTSEKKYFEQQLLDYDNNLQDKLDYTNTNFEIDLIILSQSPKDTSKICILKYNANGWVPSGVSPSGVFSYNADMKLSTLVKLFHTYRRPFTPGILSGVLFGDPVTLSLDLAYLWNNEITIPYNDQRLLDFDYLLVTSFGNLRINQISVDLQSQKATISAAKK